MGAWVVGGGCGEWGMRLMIIQARCCLHYIPLYFPICVHQSRPISVSGLLGNEIYIGPRASIHWGRLRCGVVAVFWQRNCISTAGRPENDVVCGPQKSTRKMFILNFRFSCESVRSCRNTKKISRRVVALVRLHA